MYRIKKNKRVLESAELIVQGVNRCVRETLFERINVCDIASAAGVSRATFYRIFDTPSDVLAYMCDKLAENTVNFYKNKRFASSHEMFGTCTLEYWCSQTDVIETIFRSGRSNILQKSFEKFSSEIISPVSGLSEKEFDFLRTTIIGVICSILVVWTRHGRKESPEELMEIYRKIGKTVKKLRFPQNPITDENK